MSKPNVYVFYHYPCHDGFLAQLVIKRALANYANVKSLPLQHGPNRSWDIADIEADSTVLFVDIAPSPQMLWELEASEKIHTIEVWDHHIDYRNTDYPGAKWSECTMPNYYDVTMEMARPSQKTTLWFCNEISGSRLAPIAAHWWVTRNIFVEPDLAIAQEATARWYNHPIVIHASDYDTWTKAYENTDAVFAYYRNYKYEDLARWDALLDRITAFDTPGYRDIVTKGSAMLEAVKTMAEKLAIGDNPKPIELTVPSGTYQGVVANAYGLLANDLGEVFREKYDFAIMYNVTPKLITLSIRSRPGGPSNEIAQIWGGGGHAGSAGAAISGDARFEWLKQYAFHPTE